MGTKYNPSVVRDGLMIYLDAANKASYPGTGNTWYDLKRNRNFTLQNSPPFVPDAAGGSIGFTAANSHWAVSSTSLPTLTRFTAEVWHYYTGVNSASAPAIISETYPGTNGRININLGSQSGASELRISYFNGAWNNSASYSLTAGNWYHIVGTYDGANLRLYINGVNEVTTANTGTPAANSSGIRLMARWDSNQYWGGNLSTVKIYDRALSQAEVLQNYHATKKRYGK